MATTGKSAFVKQAKKKAGKAWKTARTAEDEFDVKMADGVYQARLSSVRMGADKNNNPWVSLNFIVVAGEEKGKKPSRFYSFSETTNQTVADRIEWFVRDIKKLGAEGIEDIEIEDVPDVVEELAAEKPLCRITAKNDPDWGLQINVSGLVDGEDSEEEEGFEIEEEEEETEEESDAETYESTESYVNDLATKADDGDEEAIDKLSKYASDNDLDPDDFPDSWASLGEAIIEKEAEKTAEDVGEEEDDEYEEEEVEEEADDGEEDDGETMGDDDDDEYEEDEEGEEDDAEEEEEEEAEEIGEGDFVRITKGTHKSGDECQVLQLLDDNKAKVKKANGRSVNVPLSYLEVVYE